MDQEAHNDMPCPPKADRNTFRPRKKFCKRNNSVRLTLCGSHHSVNRALNRHTNRRHASIWASLQLAPRLQSCRKRGMNSRTSRLVGPVAQLSFKPLLPDSAQM